jgi:hypothetical protein
MAHKSDQERIEQTRNVPRFFVEHPQVSWVLLVGVLIWGWFGYKSMPQRKDPNIPVRVALASCSWPGATAQQVEQLVTRPIEDTVAQNKWIHAGTPADFGVRSISLPGYAYVYIQLVDNVDDLKRQFSDINLKLNALNGQLPQGAGPITFQSDFGDTAALMLTVASPKADSVEINPLAVDSGGGPLGSCQQKDRTVGEAGHRNLPVPGISFAASGRKWRRTLRETGDTRRCAKQHHSDSGNGLHWSRRHKQSR